MISQTTEYALRAVVFLADNPGKPFTARDIAAATGVPTGYLAKILQHLGRAGIVLSRRGVGGGFSLAVTPSQITFLNILEATDSPIERITECPLGLQTHTKLCALHQRLDAALALLEEFFSSATIQSILDEPRMVKPLCDVSNHTQLSIDADSASA